MHALIVVAHHDPLSLTHQLAKQLGSGIAKAGHSFEIADLSAEGFDPRFGPADHEVHRHQATPPADIVAEQARIDRADSLVVVFPVYWWSMPGLLKGWIDRVFSNGWAFDFSPQRGHVKKLQGLTVHLLGVAGADAQTFDKHGYRQAMHSQIDHGIFDYCGARVIGSTLLFDSETLEPTPHLQSAQSIGSKLFEKQ